MNSSSMGLLTPTVTWFLIYRPVPQVIVTTPIQQSILLPLKLGMTVWIQIVLVVPIMTKMATDSHKLKVTVMMLTQMCILGPRIHG